MSTTRATFLAVSFVLAFGAGGCGEAAHESDAVVEHDAAPQSPAPQSPGNESPASEPASGGPSVTASGAEAEAALEQEAAPADDNLLINPSFELDDESWWSFHDKSPWSWGDFEITDERAHTGERSARLVMNSPESRLPARVYGVVQEVTPETVPEYVSGWYRVEGWERGTEKQYLQVVIVAWNPTEVPEGLNASNFQVAYTMAGVSQAPLPNISNRSFIVTGPVEPVEGEWVFFELELAEAFRKQWGMAPEGFEYLRLLFEARYDEREKDEVVRATVYYDDLYIGDRSRAPEGDD